MHIPAKGHSKQAAAERRCLLQNPNHQQVIVRILSTPIVFLFLI